MQAGTCIEDMAIAGVYACALRTSNKGEGIAYVMSNCVSNQEMARSASSQQGNGDDLT
jgi:hypothetical protein